MDTRFWGPSGWHLLHILAAKPVRNPSAVKEWMELLEYVLPCKYCRASFHEYMRLQPITLSIIQSPTLFSRWMYDIHNLVNAKLRSQGLLSGTDGRDPKWSGIQKHYASMTCETSPLVGWDFMTSVAYSTPSSDYVAVPMPGAPAHISDIPTKNRYNLLSRKERLTLLRRWWELIPSILPCDSWKRAWAASADPIPLTEGREAVLSWMWRVEEKVCAGLRCPTPHPSLPALKYEVAVFESNCGRVKRGKTCRTRKHRLKRKVLSRRRARFAAYHTRGLDM